MPTRQRREPRLGEAQGQPESSRGRFEPDVESHRPPQKISPRLLGFHAREPQIPLPLFKAPPPRSPLSTRLKLSRTQGPARSQAQIASSPARGWTRIAGRNRKLRVPGSPPALGSSLHPGTPGSDLRSRPGATASAASSPPLRPRNSRIARLPQVPARLEGHAPSGPRPRVPGSGWPRPQRALLSAASGLDRKRRGP